MIEYTNIYVQLARLGDQLNLLPLLYADAQKGGISAMMVAKQYAPHLANSYADIMEWEGELHDIEGALRQAKTHGKAICTQVLGPVDWVREHTYRPAGLENAVTTSFQKEAWRVAGRLGEWDEQYPLILDDRDEKREAALLVDLPKKFVLYAFDGISSPFPFKPLALELLRHCGFALVNVNSVKVERFYDLLALYERAHCLVAIDSAPLHLAWAVPNLPVCALVNDRPLLWNGASWRPNHVWYCRYGDFPHRAPEMLEAIRLAKHSKWRLADGPKAIHVWNSYAGEKCEPPADFFVPTPITPGSCGRDSVMILKDAKRLPYLRDAIRMGLQRARPQDWVCLTGAHTRFRDGAALSLTQYQSAYAYRIEEDTFKPIGEMFWGTKPFWKSALELIPDFVFGSDYFWPHVLAAIFRRLGAVDVTGTVYRVKP